jgi:hypothetical protein
MQLLEKAALQRWIQGFSQGYNTITETHRRETHRRNKSLEAYFLHQPRLSTQVVMTAAKTKTAMKKTKDMKVTKRIAMKVMKTRRALKPMKSMKILSRATSATQSGEKKNMFAAEFHSNALIRSVGSMNGVELRKELKRAGGLVVTGIAARMQCCGGEFWHDLPPQPFENHHMTCQ